MSRLEGNINEIRIREGSTMDVKDVEGLKELNLQLAEHKDYAVLVEAGETTTITKEARELVATERFAEHTIAKAVIIHTLAQKILGNFYLSVNKPRINTKLFTERTKALEWLRLKVAEHNQFSKTEADENK